MHKNISMKYLFLLLFTLLMHTGFAQTGTTSAITKSEKIYDSVDNMPSRGFDIDSFFNTQKLTYPIDAKENGIQGKVIIKLIVHQDGTLSDFKVDRGIGYGCDEEALRVVKNMPPWKPGTQNGRPVKLHMRQPISFKLEGNRLKRKQKK